MPLFNITVVNQTFESSDEHDLPTAEEAKAEAIKGALQIGISEVGVEPAFFAAEVKIAEQGQHLARYIVSVGVSPLK